MDTQEMSNGIVTLLIEMGKKQEPQSVYGVFYTVKRLSKGDDFYFCTRDFQYRGTQRVCIAVAQRLTELGLEVQNNCPGEWPKWQLTNELVPSRN